MQGRCLTLSDTLVHCGVDCLIGNAPFWLWLGWVSNCPCLLWWHPYQELIPMASESHPSFPDTSENTNPCPLLFCEWGASCRDAPAAVFVPKPLSWPDFRLSSCLILSPYALRLSFCPSGVGFVCLLVCFAAVTNGHTLKGLTPSEVEHRAVWEVRRGTWVLLD